MSGNVLPVDLCDYENESEGSHVAFRCGLPTGHNGPHGKNLNALFTVLQELWGYVDDDRLRRDRLRVRDRLMLIRRLDTPENRAYWAHVDKCAREVRSNTYYHMVCPKPRCNYSEGDETCEQVAAKWKAMPAMSKSKESFRDQLSRVEQMGDDENTTWDLSENDTAAIRAVLADRQRLAANCNALRLAVKQLKALTIDALEATTKAVEGE